MFLTSSFLLWMAVLCVTLVYFWSYVQRCLRLSAPLTKIPGPTFIQMIKHILQYPFKGDVNDVVSYFHGTISQYTKHNSLIAFNPGPLLVVVLCKAEAVKVLLSSKTQFDKASIYKDFHILLFDTILACDSSRWHQRRKLLSPTFNSQILEKFLQMMNEKAETLVHTLDEKCCQLNGKEFDICPFISRCTLDIICETALEHRVSDQPNTGHEYLDACYSAFQLASTRSVKPWLSIDFLYRWSSLGERIGRALKTMKRFTDEIIKNKRKELAESEILNGTLDQVSDDVIGKKRQMAFLEKLLHSSLGDKGKGGQPLSEDGIRREVDIVVNAGFHTSTHTICWTLHYIGTRPDVQQKIADELDLVYGDCDRHSTSSDLHHLKYLECVIKETLRIKPPVAMIGRYLTEEMDICGYTIPAGTDVYVFIDLLHRDPENFPDPDSFNPDRFLPENSQDRHPFAFIPFSAGMRNCMGKKFGMMEIKVVLAAILKRFKVTTVDPNLPQHNFANLIFSPFPNNRVRLEPRETFESGYKSSSNF